MKLKADLRLVAWELTKRCNLNCIHCRAYAQDEEIKDEYNTERCKEILEQVSEVSKPIVILSGGEPLLRDDIYEIASYGNYLGMRMVLATNGTFINSDVVKRLKRSGIKRVSISIDGATPQSHDSFRKVEGAFERAVEGIRYLREGGMEFQINTTITKINMEEMEDIVRLALDLSASALHIFFLVPVGRAKEMQDGSMSPDEYEMVLNRFYELKDMVPLHLKATCAPQFYRILRQREEEKGRKVEFKTHGLDAISRGCLAGISFCFISHIGVIQPCGYLEVECGTLNQNSFKEIWDESSVFKDLRDLSRYKGKCGRCRYIRFCGGCRARAYEKSGDYLSEEPLCLYNP